MSLLDCLLAAISEALGLSAAWSIISLLGKLATDVLAKAALKKALREILKTWLKELVPAAALIIIAEILWHLYWCYG
ncbi:hypothetical protein [Phenylobacterium sp.]|uniref:hypothetical protein n=1 Tax=Phenylobacterium sp. TaxID=1871053 RepID=UPI002C9FBA8A|nr:hypothetical protein [Phenylobacterium sp.]HLZ75108.1 hypothetical protein [Phenylobacterium sp.]